MFFIFMYMKISLTCSVCNIQFEREKKLVNRSIRDGSLPPVCSKKCMGVRYKKPSIQKECPTCKKVFETSTAKHGKKCCSKECAKKYSYTFVNTKVHKSKVSEWAKKIKAEKPLEWKTHIKKICVGATKAAHNRIPAIPILQRDFDSICWELKRKYVIEEQNNKCFKCGIDSWSGLPLTLEVDHINGNNLDNSRNNLSALCPNCHSQTPTHRANNKRMVKKVTDKDLTEALKSEPSIRQALIKVGLTPKGGNYIRAKRLDGEINKTPTETVISLSLE